VGFSPFLEIVGIPRLVLIPKAGPVPPPAAENKRWAFALVPFFVGRTFQIDYLSLSLASLR
jgi:hypothetical protein